jgi:hypothetical protein
VNDTGIAGDLQRPVTGGALPRAILMRPCFSWWVTVMITRTSRPDGGVEYLSAVVYLRSRERSRLLGSLLSIVVRTRRGNLGYPERVQPSVVFRSRTLAAYATSSLLQQVIYLRGAC